MFEGGVAHTGSYHDARPCSNSYLHARTDGHCRAHAEAASRVDPATYGYAIAGADLDGHGGPDQRAGRGADTGTREFGNA